MNRTRASSIDAFGTRDQRNRIYPALEASDGSTLSLDFTAMSSLDTRFTFTRITPGGVSTPATFINSLGYVQYADHNFVLNSTWTDSNPVPSGWTMYNGTTPNAVVTIPETGKRSITVTSGVQSFMHQAQTVPSGLAYTLSLVVHSVSGTGPTVGNLLAFNGAAAAPENASILYYKDGVSVGASGANTEVTPGTWSMVFSGGSQIRLLQGNGVAGATYTIVISAPQLQRGVSLLPAPVPNSSTSTAYQAPRFDYDPTTLTARGLLIEGAATNLLCWSESFAISGGSTNWYYNSNTGTVVSTTNPAGGSTAFQFAETANSGPLQQSVTVTNAVHTFSAWFKASTYSGTTTTQVQFGLYTTSFVAGTASIISGPGSTSVAGNVVTLSGLSTSQWTRVQFTTTAALSAGPVAILIYPNTTGSETNASFHIWGAQLEAGSGASSYIPTGASNVTRAVDKLSMTDISLMGWNQTAGTFLWNMDVQSESNTTSFPAFAGMYRAGPVRVMRFQLNNSSGTNPRIGGDTWTATPSSIVTGAFYTRPVATTFKAAVAFANTGQSMTYCINGTVQSTATGTGTLATPTLFLMHQDPSAADTEYFPIHLRQLKYWPTNLSSSDLRSITL